MGNDSSIEGFHVPEENMRSLLREDEQSESPSQKEPRWRLNIKKRGLIEVQENKKLYLRKSLSKSTIRKSMSPPGNYFTKTDEPRQKKEITKPPVPRLSKILNSEKKSPKNKQLKILVNKKIGVKGILKEKSISMKTTAD